MGGRKVQGGMGLLEIGNWVFMGGKGCVDW